jgi:hypothetical protein
MTQKNLALANVTMMVIEANPDKHDQGSWASPCGSTMCYAGHAGVIAGAKFDKNKAGHDWYVEPGTLKHLGWDEAYSDPRYPSGEIKHISNFAAEKLGFTDAEKEYMFDPNRTVEEMEAALEAMNNGESFSDEWEMENRFGNSYYEDDDDDY